MVVFKDWTSKNVIALPQRAAAYRLFTDEVRWGRGTNGAEVESSQWLAPDTTQGRYNHLQQHSQNFFWSFWIIFFSVAKGRPKENMMQEPEHVLIECFGVTLIFNVHKITFLYRFEATTQLSKMLN